MTYDCHAIFRLTSRQKTQLGLIALATGRTSSGWIREAIERETRNTLASSRETAAAGG